MDCEKIKSAFGIWHLAIDYWYYPPSLRDSPPSDFVEGGYRGIPNLTVWLKKWTAKMKFHFLQSIFTCRWSPVALETKLLQQFCLSELKQLCKLDSQNNSRFN
jgi:hypothetical protein